LGIPALGVHAVHAVDLEIPPLELIGEWGVHAHVLPLIKAPLRGGEGDDAGACVAEDQQLHLTAEGGAEPAVIFAIHNNGASVRPHGAGARTRRRARSAKRMEQVGWAPPCWREVRLDAAWADAVDAGPPVAIVCHQTLRCQRSASGPTACTRAEDTRKRGAPCGASLKYLPLALGGSG